MDADLHELAVLLGRRIGRTDFRLTSLGVDCACPVFRGESDGQPPVFVKLTSNAAARRTLSFLSSSGEADFLPRPLMDEPCSFRSYAVLCLEWKAATCVCAEDMTEDQADAFLNGCVRLSRILQNARDVAALAEEDDPVVQHKRLSSYVARHPLVGRCLSDLINEPEVARTYGNRSLVTIHGDLQPKNYGFVGDRLAAVFDFDDLTQGLACEDVAYAFTERARRSELSRMQRVHLTDLFLRTVERSPWPWDEWLIAVNHCRLRIAVRRLEKHPDGVVVALDIARRDRPLQRLVSALRNRFGPEKAESAHTV